MSRGEALSIFLFAVGIVLFLLGMRKSHADKMEPDLGEGHLPQSPAEPDRDAIIEMIRLSRTEEERERWRLLLIEVDLAKLARQGIRSAQLFAGQARERLCPVCRALDLSIISVNAGARAVIPEDCTCRTKGLLSVSGWIKRPDGSGYMDRLN